MNNVAAVSKHGEEMSTNKVKQDTYNVLMLIENGPFPFDRRMRHLAEALHGAGYKVSVISPKGKNHDQRSFEEIDGIKVYRFPVLFDARKRFGYVFEYFWALFCLGALSLWVWIRNGIDIIHCANPPDILFLLALPFKLIGKEARLRSA